MRRPSPPPRYPRPGDLLAFSSRDFLGVVINLATWGLPFWGVSHVAIVTGWDYEWESTAHCGLDCEHCRRPVDGVQLHSIYERVKHYRGRVWLYPLAVDLTARQVCDLRSFCCRHSAVGYDYIGAFRAREAGFGWLESRLGRENLHRVFCSEFCAAALRAAGIFATGNASRWNPNRLVRTLRRADILLKPRRLK